MAVLPSLSAVTALFLVRGALYGLSRPLRGQPSMEVVGSRERGTTAGFTHTSFDLGGGVGAGIAGVLIAGGGFVLAFAVAAVLVLVPTFLYYVFFAHMEARARRPAGLPEAAPTSAGNGGRCIRLFACGLPRCLKLLLPVPAARRWPAAQRMHALDVRLSPLPAFGIL